MSLEAPVPSPKSPDWQHLLAETADALRARGVDVDWWNSRTPFPSVFLNLMRAARRNLPVEDATKTSDPELSNLLAELYPKAQEIMEQLIGDLALGDDAIEDKAADKALTYFKRAAEDALSPALQVEIGGLLLHRARIQPRPLMEVDFEHLAPYPWESTVIEPVLGPEFAPGPAMKNPGELVELALDLYGRSALFILSQSAEHPDGDDGESEADILDPWRMYLALDGIRSALLNQPDNEEVLKQICRLYSIWNTHEGWYVGDEPDRLDNPFTAKFEYLRGFLTGKETGQALATASGIAETPMLLRQISKDLEGLKPRRTRTRAEIGGSLAQHFGEQWGSLDEFVKDPLIEAEHLMESFKAGDRPDYGAVVVEYAKAVEYLCSSLDRSPSPSGVLGRFGDSVNSPLRRHMKPGAPVDQMISAIRTISSAGNQWRHHNRRGRPSRRISLAECESLRSLALGVIHDITRWRKGGD